MSLTPPFAMRPVMESTNEFWSATDWSEDGKSVLLLKYVSANDARVALLDLETGRRDDLPVPQGKRHRSRTPSSRGRKECLPHVRCVGRVPRTRAVECCHPRVHTNDCRHSLECRKCGG